MAIIKGPKPNHLYNGTNLDDQITTDNSGNRVFAGAGNDQVYGGKGNDTIDGGDGNDYIDGGNGNDVIIGGLGNDRISGGIGNDIISGGVGNDSLYGGDGNDAIDGGDGNDLVYGGFGNDTLTGGLGNDTLNGDDGNDVIDGGDGNDIINGGKGNDQIRVSQGYDVIDGGTGTDTLVFSKSSLYYKVTSLGNNQYKILDLQTQEYTLFKNIESFQFTNKTLNLKNAFLNVPDKPPVAQNSSFTVDEDGSINGKAVASDTDSVVLTYSLVGGAPAGLTFNSNGTFSFNASHAAYQSLAKDQKQSVSFHFKANDGILSSNESIITITVTGKNDAPIAPNFSFSVDEDSSLSKQVVATDADQGTTLTYLLLDPVPAGLLFNNNGTFTFDATNSAYQSLLQGKFQTLNLHYTASDGHTNSAPALLSITIKGKTDKPIVQDVSMSVNEDDSASGQMVGTDAQGAALVYNLIDPLPGGVSFSPLSGIFTLDASNSAYQSLAQGQPQTLSLKYTASNGQELSDPATITITITGKNDAPTASDITFSVNEDMLLSNQVGARDVDLNDHLTYSLVGAAPTGLTFKSDGTFTFDASDPAYQSLHQGGHQDVTFKYKANDGTVDSNEATVTITINGQNDAPVAKDVVGAVNQNNVGSMVVTVFLDATDVDQGAHLTYALVDPPIPGLRFSPVGSFTFDGSDPAYNFLAQDQTGVFTFKYVANDGALDSNEATATITIVGKNDAPAAQDDTFIVNEDSVLIDHVSASDVDRGDGLTYSLTTPLLVGLAFDNTTGNFTFDTKDSVYQSLAEGEPQNFSFKYIVTDTHGVDSNEATVTITINGQNDEPVAQDTTITVSEDGIISSYVTAQDVDHDPLTYSLVGLSPAGLTFNNDGTFTFDASHRSYQHLNSGETEVVTFQYKANDGNADSSPATVTITVNGVDDGPNTPPVALDASFSVNEDASFSDQVVATDADLWNDLIYALVDPAPSGLTFNSDGTFTFDASHPDYQSLAQDQTLDVTFQYIANDAFADSSPATVTITITGQNDIPVAQSQVIPKNEDFDFFGHVGAIDPDQGATLTYFLVGTAPIGLKFNNNGDGGDEFFFDTGNAAYQYLTLGDFLDVTFQYKAYDGIAYSDPATVTITIAGQKDKPTALYGSYDFDDVPGHIYSVAGLFIDYDNDPLTYALTNAPTGVSLDASGNFVVSAFPADQIISLEGGMVKANDGFQVSSAIALHGHLYNPDYFNLPEITGSSGDDPLFSFANRTSSDHILIKGLQGNDTIDGGAGNYGDALVGGSGSDTVSYASSTQGVTVSLNLQEQMQDTIGAGIDILIGFENLSGSNFDDILTGDGNANTIMGNAGDDLIDGGGGADFMDGGDGIDTISYASASSNANISLAAGIVYTSNGDATIANFENAIGTPFSENIIGDSNDNILAGGLGFNGIYGGDGNDTVSYAILDSTVIVTLVNQFTIHSDGSDSMDSIENVIGSSAHDSITGDSGDNIIDGYLGDDTLDGLGGQDTASYKSAPSSVTVNLATGLATGGNGNDTLANFENLLGSKFADTLTGDANNNVIDGGKGDDLLDGGDGEDTASYASATAAVTVSLALQGGGQNTIGAELDTLSNFENLLGSKFADTLTGDVNANVIDGGLGDDILDGGDGNDTVSYASATSAVTVNLALGTSSGGAGLDTLTNFENILGSSFDDSLFGNDDTNTLTGGAGNDTLSGGLGDDILDGGDGTDTASYANSASSVTINMATGINSGGGGSDTFLNIEGVVGSNFNDILIGDSGVNTLNGGAGDDILDGGLGNDILIGGDGLDTVTYATASASVSVNLLTGKSSGAAGSDTLSGIEKIIGSNFNDSLTGDSNDNIFDGGLGNDIITGNGGIDTVTYETASSAVTVNLQPRTASGGAGSDTLTSIENVIGSSFDDIITGSNSNNVLNGGAGNDILQGSTTFGTADMDTFLFDVLSAFGNDEIRDFNIARSDIVQFSGVIDTDGDSSRLVEFQSMVDVVDDGANVILSVYGQGLAHTAANLYGTITFDGLGTADQHLNSLTALGAGGVTILTP